MYELEIVELAMLRAYNIDYGMHAKNLMKVAADQISHLKFVQDGQSDLEFRNWIRDEINAARKVGQPASPHPL